MVTTKQVIKQIGKDVYNGTKKIGRTILKGACIASYPIIGNMPCYLQEKIGNKLERLLGPSVYDKDKAFKTSLAINIALYPLLAGYLSYNIPISTKSDRLGNALSAGLITLLIPTFIETAVRLGLAQYKNQTDYEMCYGHPIPGFEKHPGNLIGKIACLPLEGILRYIDNVKERLKR